ncbi:hypothetical protein DITRI_Ditri07aG0133000 [Diplodiscus trichospermus]
MEGAKRLMGSLMVLMMVVLAQGRAELADVHHPPKTKYCAKKCFYKCILRLIPQRIALCFGLCMLGCKLKPSQVVYNCTYDCANSMVNAYKPTDAEKVEVFVGSCYKTCKQKNNN